MAKKRMTSFMYSSQDLRQPLTTTKKKQPSNTVMGKILLVIFQKDYVIYEPRVVIYQLRWISDNKGFDPYQSAGIVAWPMVNHGAGQCSGCFLIKLRLENTKNCFAYISATKFRSEAILYSKQTTGYSLLPHIKTMAVAFLQVEL